MHANDKHGGLTEGELEETPMTKKQDSNDSLQENSLRNLSKEILGIFFGSQARHSVEREVLRLAAMTAGRVPLR